MANVVPAIENPTACPLFFSKNVFNATKDAAVANPVPNPNRYVNFIYSTFWMTRSVEN